MKKNLLFVSLFALMVTGISQISYEERIEFELKDGYSDEKIIVFGELGFIMTSKNKEDVGEKQEWKYEQFSTNIESINTVNILINKKYSPYANFTDVFNTYTFFQDRKGHYSLVAVEASSLNYSIINGVLPPKSNVLGMSVLGDFAFLKLIIKKAPYLYIVNMKTEEMRLLPITIKDYKPQKISMREIQVLPEANELFLYLKVQIEKKISNTYVIRLNNQGEQEGLFNLSKNINKNIIDISASKIDDYKYIYTGTYSSETLSTSEGVFFCQTSDDNVDFVKYYSFVNLSNFLKYLPERSLNKIEKKKKKKERKGEEFVINYQIAAHNIIPVEDGFLFLGEAFYPTYRTETRTTTTYVNGRMSTTYYTVTVFDGYQYTHAMLCKFDFEGNMEWDQIFEMWSAYKPFHVKKFISIASQNANAINLVYSSRNKITAKSIDYEGMVLQDSQSEEIQTNFEGDKTRSSFSEIDFWYDNYFIAYGQQKIKNTDGEGSPKKKRSVFFVSKIKYE